MKKSPNRGFKKAQTEITPESAPIVEIAEEGWDYEDEIVIETPPRVEEIKPIVP